MPAAINDRFSHNACVHVQYFCEKYATVSRAYLTHTRLIKLGLQNGLPYNVRGHHSTAPSLLIYGTLCSN